MKLNDIVAKATDFCLQSRVRFNPYLPLCVDYRCITLPPHLGDKIKAEPRENIYHYSRVELGKFYHHRSNFQRDDINGKVLLAVKDGYKGASTDYAGAIILMYFRNDPQGFDDLFYSVNSRLTPAVVVSRILELPEKVTVPYNRLADEMFNEEGGNIQDPRYHERVLRKLMSRAKS